MKQTLGHIALVVRDYDEALKFFTRTLNFELIEDTPLSEAKRWVLVAPPGSQGTSLLLAQAATPEQASRIGNQTGGGGFFFFSTHEFSRGYKHMPKRNRKIIPPPHQKTYGTSAHLYIP